MLQLTQLRLEHRFNQDRPGPPRPAGGFLTSVKGDSGVDDLSDIHALAAEPEIPAIIAFPADVDYQTAWDIWRQVTNALERGAQTLILDLSATTFCATAGIAVIARTRRLARATRTALHTVIPPGPAYRALALAGLDQLLAIYPTLGAALAAGHQQRPGTGPPARSAGEISWPGQP